MLPVSEHNLHQFTLKTCWLKQDQDNRQLILYKCTRNQLIQSNKFSHSAQAQQQLFLHCKVQNLFSSHKGSSRCFNAIRRQPYRSSYDNGKSWSRAVLLGFYVKHWHRNVAYIGMNSCVLEVFLKSDLPTLLPVCLLMIAIILQLYTCLHAVMAMGVIPMQCW